MLELKTEFLYEIEGILGDRIPVGTSPLGTRIIANVVGGSFEGPKLKGKVLNSGADWMLSRSDGRNALDVRIAMETDDGAVIYVTYNGRLYWPEELAGRLFNPDTVADVDPSEYYFRITPYFETGSDKYAWLNNIVAVGVGRITAEGVGYSVYEVK